MRPHLAADLWGSSDSNLYFALTNVGQGMAFDLRLVATLKDGSNEWMDEILMMRTTSSLQQG